MNYLTASIRSPLSPSTFFLKASQSTLRPGGIKAATIGSLFFPIRYISDRAKVPTTPLKSPMTVPQDSGSSDSDDRAPKSRPRAQLLPLPSPPTNCRGTRRAKPILSYDDITRRGFRRLLNLTEAYKYIEDEADRSSRASLSRLEDELRQETKVALGQQGMTKAKEKEIQQYYEEQRRGRKKQAVRRSLEDVLKGWELSEEGFARLKNVVQIRNTLVHPVLRREDVAIILKDWKREGGGQDGDGEGNIVI